MEARPPRHDPNSAKPSSSKLSLNQDAGSDIWEAEAELLGIRVVT